MNSLPAIERRPSCPLALCCHPSNARSYSASLSTKPRWPGITCSAPRTWQSSDRSGAPSTGLGSPSSCASCGIPGKAYDPAKILEAAADGAREAVPALCLAVKALRAPAVTLVEPLILHGPTLTAPPGSKERRVIITEYDDLVCPSFREAVRPSSGIVNSPWPSSKKSVQIQVRKIRPLGHFATSCLASYRNRRVGTRHRIGSAFAGMMGSIPAAPDRRKPCHKHSPRRRSPS